jgi:hypothetical protein
MSRDPDKAHPHEGSNYPDWCERTWNSLSIVGGKLLEVILVFKRGGEVLFQASIAHIGQHAAAVNGEVRENVFQLEGIPVHGRQQSHLPGKDNFATSPGSLSRKSSTPVESGKISCMAFAPGLQRRSCRSERVRLLESKSASTRSARAFTPSSETQYA